MNPVTGTDEQNVCGFLISPRSGRDKPTILITNIPSKCNLISENLVQVKYNPYHDESDPGSVFAPY